MYFICICQLLFQRFYGKTSWNTIHPHLSHTKKPRSASILRPALLDFGGQVAPAYATLLAKTWPRCQTLKCD